jgi:hypothetical protein
MEGVMRFTERETALIVNALIAQASVYERLEETNTLRQRYPGITEKGKAACARKVDEYRAEREELEALVARFEYVGGEA